MTLKDSASRVEPRELTPFEIAHYGVETVVRQEPENEWAKVEVARWHLEALLGEIARLRLAVRSIDEPYPVDVFPDLQERDAVFAAMREVNRYATEQFCAEIARQRGSAARSYLEDGDLADGS